MPKEIDSGTHFMRYILLVVIVGIVIILISGSIVIVGVGQRGILTRFGAITGTTFYEGLHFKAPFIDGVEIMNVKTQVTRFDNAMKNGDNSEYSSLFAASKDLQDVQIAVIVNYHLQPDKVMEIYQTVGGQSYYIDAVVEPIIRETIKSQSALYTAEELVTKRLEFSSKVESLLAERLNVRFSVLEKFSVVNLEFSPSFTSAIEAKVTAEQDALKSKNVLEQVKTEAEQQRQKAQGIADAKLSVAEAEAKSIELQGKALRDNPDVVSLRWIEKWDGKVPTYSMGAGSNTGVLLNIP